MKSSDWLILGIIGILIWLAIKSGIFTSTGGGGTPINLSEIPIVTTKLPTPIAETTAYVDRIFQPVTPPTPYTYNQDLLSKPVDIVLSGTPPQQRQDQWWNQAPTAPTIATVGKTWTPAEIAAKNREAGLGQAYGAGVGFGGGGAGIRSGSVVRTLDGGAGVR